MSRFGRGWRHLYGRGLRKDFGTPPFHSAGSPDNTSLFNSAQAACEQGWPQIRAHAVGLANTTATFASNTCTLKEGATVRGTLPIHQSPHGAGTSTLAIHADRRRQEHPLCCRGIHFLGGSGRHRPPRARHRRLSLHRR